MNLDVDIDDMDMHLVVGLDIDFRSSLGAATGQDVSVVVRVVSLHAFRMPYILNPM